MASETKEDAADINDTSAEPKSQAFTHLSQGKRHLLVGDYEEAVRSFADACALMVKLYGETANECGEVYLNYGIALLELARTENGVLGMEGEGGEKESEDEDEKPAKGGKEPAENGKNTKQESEANVENSEAENSSNKDQDTSVEEKPAEGRKEPAEHGKDSKQESETNVENSEAENFTNKDQDISEEEKPAEGGKEPAENDKDSKQESETNLENSESENSTNKDQDTSEKTEVADEDASNLHLENGKDSKQESDTNVENSEAENPTNKDQDTGEKTEVADEDVSNLHLAWEVLELAKIIFQRQSEGNKQMELKLAEVNLKLGEVGLESETYSQAIEDIKACLEIRKRVLEEHDRCIAETYYQLGMAYSLTNEFDDAVTNFTLAHALLEKRIQLLQEKMKQGEKAEQSEANAFYTLQGEITELNNLLPEVKEKISDIQDFKKDTKKALYARIGSGDDQSSSSTPSTSSAFPDAKLDSEPATDISHLVRKKRKPEPDSSEGKSAKQPCLDGAKAE